MSNLKNLDQLEETLDKDPDNLEQIQYWYEEFSEYEIDGTEPADYLLLLFRGLKWVMQYEHTTSEELKELAERQAVEIAEKEDNFEQERNILKEEISSLRERITSKAGMDEMNEAFRAEIDSLNAENAHLKQMGRDRDRELADQRDKVEELTSKIGVFERDRNAWTSTQIQLEDTIRELNRRLNAKNDLAPRSEWESRKLKQRSEQAIMLGNQLRNADAQNSELKERVESLTKALEEATSLLQETTKKYEKLREQLSNTTATAEKLLKSNQDLKRMLDMKDEILGDKEQTVESTTKQLEELVRTKESQIQRLRETNQKYEMQLEELQARLQSEHSIEREEELERLRLELVEATKVARQLFGESLVIDADEESQHADLTAKLRLHIVQVNRELDQCREQLRISNEEQEHLTKLVEQKDSQLAQLYAEVDRVRKLAFGDKDSYIRNLEKQIEFRERQISKLTLKCSLMQIDLESKNEVLPKKTPIKTTSKRNERKQKEKKPEEPKEEISIESSSSSVSEEIKEEEAIIKSQPQRHFSAIELIKLLDDNDIGEKDLKDYNVLSSLFVELKRLNRQNNEKEKQIQDMSAIVSEEQRKLLEQNAKLKKLQDEYENFRLDIFGTTNLETDAEKLHRRIEELQIENMEFRRFVDGVKIGGSELERRFEEATRRLIHLGIQVTQFERKLANLTRRHKALGDESERRSLQLMRFQSGDERRLKQISRENELNMIEIARLQNALVHSVPLQSYNKILSDFKKLLHTQTLSQLRGVESVVNADHGYESDIEKQAQFDISLNEFMRQNRSDEHILTENAQLRESIDVLTKQIEYWKRQHSKQADEIQELNAFMDELENQTDLKSMIANIQRRFVQALREQSDSVEEQLTNEKEVKRLRRDIHVGKMQWRQDRQRLIEIIMNLQLSVQRLRSKSANSLSVSQLVALRTATEELKNKEQTVEKQLNEAELKLIDLERKEALTEATRESIQELLNSNFQLQDMQLAFQRSAFHIKTLANELKTKQKKLDSLSSELKKQTEENEELRKELDELVIASTDPLKLNVLEEPTEITKESRIISEIEPQSKRILFHLSESDETSSESDRQTPRSLPSHSHQNKTTLIVSNSEEYEREINAIKNAARIAIQNYKDQLERKERAIDEYRAMLTELSASTNAQASRQLDTNHQIKDLPFKRSAEILNNAESEEREKQLIILRWQIAELEDANAALAEKLRITNDVNDIHNTQTVGCQTDFNLATIGHATDLPDKTNDDISDEDQLKDHISEESSDSGTAVGDIEEDEQILLRKDQRHSNSMRTIDRSTSALSETQIFQHRNEVRRLRNRISALERKNRELTTEYESLKQRTRHLPQRNLDPNAEINIMRKESDRMRRENKNLQQTLKTQSEQIEDLEKKLKRRTEHMRDTIESWEEKKALEKELRSAKQKIQIADGKLVELNDKLERRDRLIENLNRAQNERVFSVDKYKNELNGLRKREEGLQRTEATLRNENLVLQERIRDANNRIELALKENSILRARFPKTKSTTSIQIQTPNEWISKGQTQAYKVVEFNYTQNSTHKRQNFGVRPTLIDSSTNTDASDSSQQDMKRSLKKAKLEYTELMQQFEEISQNYEKLDDEYRRYKSFRRKETFDTAAVALLEDKLRAKQREIDRQRQTIEELEQHLQRLRIDR